MLLLPGPCLYVFLVVLLSCCACFSPKTRVLCETQKQLHTPRPPHAVAALKGGSVNPHTDMAHLSLSLFCPRRRRASRTHCLCICLCFSEKAEQRKKLITPDLVKALVGRRQEVDRSFSTVEWRSRERGEGNTSLAKVD